MLVRFVNEEFEIVQRLVRLYVLVKSLSANELARDIITTLCTGLQIPASTIMQFEVVLVSMVLRCGQWRR